MKLTISEGNMKIGNKVPNVSLPPGKSCIPGAPCLNDGCYAMKAYRMYPNVRAAWDGNLELWDSNPSEYIGQIGDYLNAKKSSRFRWHVGGDIPDQMYADAMKELAEWFPAVSFLCFTKKSELDLSGAPSNFSIVLSAWPGVELHNPLGLPVAWLAEDPRAPINDTHVHCPGQCGECEYKCWSAVDSRLDVIFNRH